MVKSELNENAKSLTIRISGKFDFSCHQQFINVYESCPSDYRYCIDMSDTTYMDSSALGMLLLLRDYAGGDHASIEITNVSNDLKKTLEVSNFRQLFNIS